MKPKVRKGNDMNAPDSTMFTGVSASKFNELPPPPSDMSDEQIAIWLSHFDVKLANEVKNGKHLTRLQIEQLERNRDLLLTTTSVVNEAIKKLLDDNALRIVKNNARNNITNVELYKLANDTYNLLVEKCKVESIVKATIVYGGMDEDSGAFPLTACVNLCFNSETIMDISVIDKPLAGTIIETIGRHFVSELSKRI